MAVYSSRSGASADDLTDYWKARARRAMGLSNGKNMLFDIHIFGNRHSNAVGTPSGTGTTAGPQWVRYNCVGADVTRNAFNIGGAQIIQIGAAKKWWIAGRFRLTSATYETGSHGGIGAGPGNGAETLVVGARGATNTSNYVVYGGNGTDINSGLALDTTRRTHEFVRNGTTGQYWIDEILRGTGDARPTADTSMAWVAAAAAAVNRSIEFSWVAVAAELE